jgi:hypothetical protein
LKSRTETKLGNRAGSLAPNSEEQLPTVEEIAVDWEGGHFAITHFHGKTLAEAEELFACGRPHAYAVDFEYMEPVGFRFYIRAAVNFCLSDRSDGESDFIHALACVLSMWRESKPSELIPCARLLADFCGKLVQQFDRYDAHPYIYEGLREKYSKFAEYFTRVAAQASDT